MAHDQTYERYYSELTKKVGLTEVNEVLLQSIIAEIQDRIQDRDMALVACTDKLELQELKYHFLIQRFQFEDGPYLDEALNYVCDQYKAGKSKKYLGVFLYLLLIRLAEKSREDGRILPTKDDFVYLGLRPALLHAISKTGIPLYTAYLQQQVVDSGLSPDGYLGAGTEMLGLLEVGSSYISVAMDYILRGVEGLETLVVEGIQLGPEQWYYDSLDIAENFTIEIQTYAPLRFYVQLVISGHTDNQFIHHELAAAAEIQQLRLFGTGTLVADMDMDQMIAYQQVLHLDALVPHFNQLIIHLGDLRVFSPLERILTKKVKQLIRSHIEEIASQSIRNMLNQALPFQDKLKTKIYIDHQE